MIWIPDGLDPEEAADFAREEVEAEIAWAEERERELEEAEEQRRQARDAAFDSGFQAYIDEQMERASIEGDAG